MTKQFDVNKIQDFLTSTLLAQSSSEKAQRMLRFFPANEHQHINFAGAMAGDINASIKAFHTEYSDLTPEQVLQISEGLLKNAQYSEEIMLVFGILNKYVKKHFDHKLVDRFTYWLEHYVSNWAHVDDLCLKTVYPFLLARPELIEGLALWSHSKSRWCRRASCVVWVKFIHRPIAKNVYELPLNLVFENCDRLMLDDDIYVQKAVGWLLKVASVYHKDELTQYLVKNKTVMQRATLHYACEKLSKQEKAAIVMA